jgi:hypothetical protein
VFESVRLTRRRAMPAPHGVVPSGVVAVEEILKLATEERPRRRLEAS